MNETKLTRFGDVAIDWSTVYAVTREAKITGDDSVHPFAAPPTSITTIIHSEITPDGGKTRISLRSNSWPGRTWMKAKNDPRFSIYDEDLAVDLSKVCAINAIQKDGESFIVFRLSDGGAAKLLINQHIAAAILYKLLESDGT